MNSKHKPWYKTKWGLPVAVLVSPFWFIWKRSRRNRFLRTIVGGTAALLIFLLLVTSIAHMFKNEATDNNPTSQNGSSQSGGSNVTLAGYGATLAEWSATHTEDNSSTPNTAYDPTSDLGNGYADKYSAVLWIGSRALGYQIGFPNGTSLSQAKTVVMREFPSDAYALWQQQNNSDSVNICYQMEVHSNSVAKAVGSSGNVFVEFQTIATSDTSNSVGYYSNNINNANLRNTNYKTAHAVGGC